MTNVLRKSSYTKSQLFGLVLGVILFILINWVIPFDGLSREGVGVLATLLLMASWWLFESINTGITGLLPLVLFPLLGSLSAGATAGAYGSNTIFMFFGGFAISLALEKWNLHNRIALNIINVVGTSINRLILGLILSGGFISMWVSNTATILMLLPIATAIAGKIDELMQNEEGYTPKDGLNFKKSAIFAVGFGSIIGGNGTLIGTPTNIILAGFTPDMIDYVMPFGNFLLFMIPLMILQYIVIYFILTKLVYKVNITHLDHADAIIKQEIKNLGKLRYEEIVTLIIFGITVFMWVSRTFLFADFTRLTDTIISIIAAVLFYLVPAKDGGRLLNSDSITKFPWGVILMLMGGMAIAAGFTQTDLAEYLGSLLLVFEGQSLIVLISIVALFGLLMTQVAPNTSSATILIPISASIAKAMNIPPLYLMLAAALSTGYATTLPSGTPVMGIMYGTGEFKVSELVKVGGLLAIITEIFLIFVIYFLTSVFFTI